MFILTDPKWHQGAKLEEYEGTWSIISAKEGDKGVFAQWCKPQTGWDNDTSEQTYASKDVPMAVRLGEIDDAIDACEQFVDYLKKIRDGDTSSDSGQIEDDLPF